MKKRPITNGEDKEPWKPRKREQTFAPRRVIYTGGGGVSVRQEIPIEPPASMVSPTKRSSHQLKKIAGVSEGSRLNIEYRSVDVLVPYARNARTHTDEQIGKIAESIQSFGWTNPVLIDDSGGVIAGHGRILAAKRLGIDKVPCVRLAHMDETQRRAYILADNRLAEDAGWDKELLKLELGELKDLGFDLQLTGFTLPEIDKLIQGKTADPDTIDDVSAELPGVAALKPDIIFPSDLPYSIPPIREDMLAEWPKPGVFPWTDAKYSRQDDGKIWYYWTWGFGGLRGAPMDRMIAGFNTDDIKFENVWATPEICIAKLLNVGFKMASEVDFSVFWGTPEAAVIWNVYRTRWLSRYMQEAGIKIIPQIKRIEKKYFDHGFIGVPMEPPCVMLDLQSSGRRESQSSDDIQVVREVAKRLRPRVIIGYGGENTRKVLDMASPKGVECIHVHSRIMELMRARPEAYTKKERKGTMGKNRESVQQ